jgi:uncharacterized protein YukE
MSSTVINDPQSINQFRGQIGEAIDNLKIQLRKTESAIEEVSESWQDNQFQQFRDNFNVDKEQIKPLYEVLENYKDNILYELEKKLYNYLDVSMHR